MEWFFFIALYLHLHLHLFCCDIVCNMVYGYEQIRRLADREEEHICPLKNSLRPHKEGVLSQTQTGTRLIWVCYEV